MGLNYESILVLLSKYILVGSFVASESIACDVAASVLLIFNEMKNEFSISSK